MKHKTGLIGVILVLTLAVGCAGLGKKSPAQLVEEYTAKAKAYEAQGDMVEALEQYKLVLTVDPQNQLANEKSTTIGQVLHTEAEAHYQIGLKFYNQGQYRQARKEFLTALRYNPEHAEAKDKLTATKKEIEQVTRYIVHTLQPDETISTLADKYYGDYRKFHLIAEYNELEDATKVATGQQIKIPVIEGMPIIADRATIQTDTGKPSEPMPDEIITAKGYITHSVQPEETFSKLAQRYYGDLKKYDVIAKFNSLEDGIPLRVGQQLKIPEIEGLPFFTEGKIEDTKVVSIPPTMPTAVEESKKQKKEANGEKQITSEDQADNYRKLGIELYLDKEYNAAITEFQKVLSVNPNDKITLDYLALAYFENGRRSFEKEAYSQAIKDFEASLKYNENCHDCQEYINRSREKYLASLRNDAITLYNQKKFRKAIVKLDAIAKKNPDDSMAREYLAKSHFQQGLVLFGKEDYLSSRDEFKTALQYDDNCDKCEENIQKCEDIYKEVHYDKGIAFFGNQKLADAIAEWELVYALDPNYKAVNKNLTKARTLLERLESIKRSKTQENKQ